LRLILRCSRQRAERYQSRKQTDNEFYLGHGWVVSARRDGLLTVLVAEWFTVRFSFETGQMLLQLPSDMVQSAELLPPDVTKRPYGYIGYALRHHHDLP
jgi:hypothetical protein